VLFRASPVAGLNHFNRFIVFIVKTLLAPLQYSRIALAKGDYLFRQGDPVTCFYRLQSGRVQLRRDTVEGGCALIHVALSGETVAEASLFADRYHCSAIASARSAVMAYNKPALLSHLETHPAAMKTMLQIFARQVRNLRAINEIKNIHGAKARILAYLHHAMNAQREVALTMSLKDLAYKLGMAHETFYRALKQLEVGGVVIRERDFLKLQSNEPCGEQMQ